LEQKHLLSVNLTEDKTNVYYDDTPFTAARLTPETRKAHEASADEVHKILMKGMKLPLLFAGYILIGIGILTYVFGLTKKSIKRPEGAVMVLLYFAAMAFAIVR
jgi:hypothetical protein